MLYVVCYGIEAPLDSLQRSWWVVHKFLDVIKVYYLVIELEHQMTRLFTSTFSSGGNSSTAAVSVLVHSGAVGGENGISWCFGISRG